MSEVRFIGKDRFGFEVVQADGMRVRLTKCCAASAKGSMSEGGQPATVCRHCYEEVDPIVGMEVTDEDMKVKV